MQLGQSRLHERVARHAERATPGALSYESPIRIVGQTQRLNPLYDRSPRLGMVGIDWAQHRLGVRHSGLILGKIQRNLLALPKTDAWAG